jgi:hypothetical protein
LPVELPHLRVSLRKRRDLGAGLVRVEQQRRLRAFHAQLPAEARLAVEQAANLGLQPVSGHAVQHRLVFAQLGEEREVVGAESGRAHAELLVGR